jgi:hypothetical protein
MIIAMNIIFQIAARISPLLVRLIVALLFAQSVSAEENGEYRDPSHSSVTLGAEYISDTSIPNQELSQVTIPLLLTRETDDYAVELVLPYLQRTAPSGKVAKSHHHESKNDSSAVSPRLTNEGLGDISTSLQRTLMSENSAAFSLFARGEIKFGTADVKRGLGTGKNDYFLEIKASRSFDAFTGHASIGHAKFGSPGEVKVNDVKKSIYFRDIYFGSVGGIYKISENLRTGLMLEMGQAAELGGYQQRDLSVISEYSFSTGRSARMQILKSVTHGISSWGLNAYLWTAL